MWYIQRRNIHGTHTVEENSSYTEACRIRDALSDNNPLSHYSVTNIPTPSWKTEN